MPCIRSGQGEVIPPGGLVYKPNPQKTSFKAVKEPVVSIPCLQQNEINFFTQQPQRKKTIVSIPKLSQQEINLYLKPKEQS